MASFGLELSLRVRNVAPNEAATGIRAVIYRLQESDNNYIAQTETAFEQTNVTFQHRCPLTYRFDRLERLKISVYCVKDGSGIFSHRIGEVYTDVATIISKGTSISLPLSPTAAIDLYITIPGFYTHYVKLKFCGNHLQVHDQLPIAAYMIFVLKTDNHAILLYKSEVIRGKNPKWKEFSVPLYVIQFFQQGALQIFCYNQNVNAADTLIGFCNTSMAQLERGAGALNSYMLMNFEGKRVHDKMSVDLESMELVQGESFFNAIKEGTSLHLTTAIDLSASNGNPNQPGSLHYIHPHTQSPYYNVMLRLTPLFLSYMANSRIGMQIQIKNDPFVQEIPPLLGALGFGARVQPRFELSQCFALSGSHGDPQVDGIKGLLDAYRAARLMVQPFAPTDFSEVIYHVSKFAKAETKRRLGLYFVLLILTDGGLANPRRTIDAIVDCSAHPMSIIAVGIGRDGDFANVKALESPVLKHSDGRTLFRQNFQFLTIDSLDTDEAIALIPLQIAQWRTLAAK
ncbi:Copine [Oesophagostomum dentatum]|uniref:Copine n=1 Tax=Oesophagostomum dentatum TaxID=61180 RepID=A0A0B1TD66_OESDE|nr:Copine [Oesophagostomum dentatum]